MSPGQHFIISWVVSNSLPLDRKSRIYITASGLIPDVDGIGYVPDKINQYLGHSSGFYEQFHHLLGHNIFFGCLVAILGFCYCGKRLAVLVLAFTAFNLHILCDIAGAKGPDGDQWPIAYLFPLFPDVQLVWSGQWELNSWINSAIGILFFIAAIVIARYRHVTFFELFSQRIENTVQEVAKNRKFFKS